MAKPLKVVVRKRHIDRAHRNNPLSCPVALALQEELITTNVNVRSDSFSVNGYSFDMTERMRRFVQRFDNGERVGPWTFYLDGLMYLTYPSLRDEDIDDGI